MLVILFLLLSCILGLDYSAGRICCILLWWRMFFSTQCPYECHQSCHRSDSGKFSLCRIESGLWPWASYKVTLKKSIYLELNAFSSQTPNVRIIAKSKKCGSSQETQAALRKNPSSKMRKDSARKIGAITQNGHFALISSVDNMINHTGAVSFNPFISSHYKNFE